MDFLKQELLKKPQILIEETGGRLIFKRFEIEQKQIQKIREQKKRELEAKSHRQSSSSDAASKPNPPPPSICVGGQIE
ncbi:hypothetical protein NL676_032134 [Syzygium grande]|nr:hypothetical protein NL676_032134 [Syzygium grande]